ncbi:MAG: T9SS type A sorting domain-containing protein [Crocinitomix sp.]|nr:T9SS type A sorting domain-containing protein [Crocinitomix sp.]
MLKSKILLGTLFFILTGFGQTFEWGIINGGTGLDAIYNIGVTSDGSIISVGIFEETVDFDPGADEVSLTSFGEIDVFIHKTNSDGELIWAVSIGGENAENSTSMTLDADDNIFIAGSFESTVDFDPGAGVFNLTAPGADPHENFILKLDPDGNFLWAKSFGGDLNEANNEIKVDGDGNIYCAGFFEGTVDLDPGAAILEYTATGIGSAFVIKLDENGDLIWHYVINGITAAHGNSAYEVVISEIGEVTLTGHFSETVDFDFSEATYNATAVGGADVFVLRLNADGEFIWMNSFGGSGTDRCFQAKLDAEGNTYITGEFIHSFTITLPDGEETFTSHGSYDIFLAKLDSDGNFLWMKIIGGVAPDGGRAVYLCADGNLAITGRFQSVVDFDPNEGVFELNSSSSIDGYIGKISPSGNLLWAESFGGSASDFGLDIKETADGSIYVCGAFNESADLNPGGGIQNVTSAGSYDGFLLKLSGTVGLTPNELPKVTLYPNPANTEVFLEFNEVLNQSKIKVFNISGQVVYTNYYPNETPRNLRIELNQEPGVYFVHVNALDRETLVFKLIVM